MISVILPYFNKEQQIPYTLCSLEMQTVKPDEVIIVDDGSDVIPTYNTTLNVEYVRLRIDGGYRTSVFAMNEGIRRSKGDIIILTSSETIQAPFNIENTVNELKQDPKVVVVGKVMYADTLNKRFPESVKLVPELVKDLPLTKWKKGLVTDDDMIIQYPNMTNGFYGFKRKTIYKVNGFDEELPYWGCNDTNLDLRLTMAGIKKVRLSTIYGLHQYHDRPPQSHMEEAVKMREVSDKPKSYYCKKGLDG